MRLVDIRLQRLQDAFAEKAAAAFAADEKMTTFTDGDIEPGVAIALRWGTHNRAVLVLRLDEAHEPVVYSDLVLVPSDDDVPF